MPNNLSPQVRMHFRPEFINRIDEFIVFQGLRLEQIKSIVLLQVGGWGLAGRVAGWVGGWVIGAQADGTAGSAKLWVCGETRLPLPCDQPPAAAAVRS
jgi:hypothetical protein